MSLLTRCPACTTIYRVVPDQLRISDGWVKCGHCSEIFDASKHLMDIGIPATIPEQPANEPEAVDPPLPTVEPTVADEAHGTTEPTNSGLSAPVDPPLDVADQADVATVAPDLSPSAVSTSSDNNARPPLRWDDHPETQNSNQEPPPPEGPEDLPPSFLTPHAVRSPWKKRLVLGVLVLTNGLLGLTLVAQWLHAEKDRLAAQYPTLKLSLDQFCTLAQCTVQPLRQIESLSVDSVGFSQLGKETYRLNFVVKNASALPLALPAIELSLTDAQDEPAYRRVFNAIELADTNPVINAGAEWATSVVLKVDSESVAKPVRGYRLLIFYP